MSTFTVPKKGWLAPKRVVLFEDLVRDGKRVSEIAKAIQVISQLELHYCEVHSAWTVVGPNVPC